MEDEEKLKMLLQVSRARSLCRSLSPALSLSLSHALSCFLQAWPLDMILMRLMLFGYPLLYLRVFAAQYTNNSLPPRPTHFLPPLLPSQTDAFIPTYREEINEL
jgi:hypothetical protein